LKIKHSGRLATFLLDVFVYSHSEEVTIRSEDLVQRNICKKGEFSELREELIKSEVLSWKMSGRQIDEYNRYKALLFKAGPRILRYIDEEKSKLSVRATMENLDTKADASEVENLKKRVEKLEKTQNKFMIAYFKENPPDTPERRRMLEDAVEEEEKLIH
jgi:maltodextrin utilization protein YvdJ